MKILNFNFSKNEYIFYISFFILCLLYLLPYIFITSEFASLLSNQLRILISFVGALIVFSLQRKSFSFYYLIVLLLLYLLQSVFLVFNGMEIFFFRALSLSYIFISFFAVLIFQHKKHIDAEKFNYLFNLIILVFFIFISYQLYKNFHTNFIVRPHGLIILFVVLTAAGLKLGKLSTFILFFGTLVLSYFSYNSRIAILVVSLILVKELGIKKVLIVLIPLIAFIPFVIFDRFEQNGLEDFGRAYIYDCFITNFDKLNLLLPTYIGLNDCYEFEYLHSTYLILFVEYGSISGFILILTSLFIFIKIFIKKNENYPSPYVFLCVLLFSTVEGGMEWFYIFNIGLCFYNFIPTKLNTILIKS